MPTADLVSFTNSVCLTNWSLHVIHINVWIGEQKIYFFYSREGTERSSPETVGFQFTAITENFTLCRDLSMFNLCWCWCRCWCLYLCLCLCLCLCLLLCCVVLCLCCAVLCCAVLCCAALHWVAIASLHPAWCHVLCMCVCLDGLNVHLTMQICFDGRH